jgi:uncharacterized protein YjbI with pentapeptide repeats
MTLKYTREDVIAIRKARGQPTWWEPRALDYVTLVGADLAGLDLSYLDMSGMVFNFADLSHTNMSNCDLTKAVMRGVKVEGTNFSNSSLSGATLENIKAHGAKFYKANLTRTSIIRADFTKADLRYANMAGILMKYDAAGEQLSSLLWHTDLSRANLEFADMRGVDLSGANFTSANLSEANISNSKIDECIFTDAILCRINFLGAIGEIKSLKGADLTGAIMPDGSEHG